MQYIVKMPDGSETQPIDDNTLKQWAETGKINTETQVRNALFNKWKEAKDLKILEEPFARRGKSTKSIEFTDTSISLDEDVLYGNEPEEEKAAASATSLNAPGKFKFVTAGAILRLLAYLTDLLFLVVVVGGINSIILLFAPDTVIEQKAFTFGLLGMNLIAYLMYFATRIGLKAQTFGQLFWGLITVRAKNGGPVFLGRALFYAVLLLFFGWLSPFLMYVTPTKRTLQDLLTDTRVIKLR